MLLKIIYIFMLSSFLYAVNLKTAAQQSAPKYFKSQSGKIVGINIDIMNAIEEIDSTIRFEGRENFLPFKRLRRYLEDGTIDVFFGLKKTDKRLKKYTYLDIPLYTINYVVANRVDDEVKINSLKDIYTLSKKEIILTVNGTEASRFLHNNCKVYIDDSAKTPTILLKMLIKKRGRYAFYHDLGLSHIIKINSFENEIKILPIKFLTYNHYVAFSKYTPIEYIDRVRVALKKLEKKGILKKIYMKYHVNK